MLKLYEPCRDQEILKISTVHIWSLRVKKFFLQFLVVILTPWILIQDAKIALIHRIRILSTDILVNLRCLDISGYSQIRKVLELDPTA